MDHPGRRDVRLRGNALHDQRFPGAAQADAAPHPPIIIGGVGAKRTPCWPRRSPTSSTSRSRRWTPSRPSSTGSRAAVEAVGRPADSMTYSAAFVVCAGRDDAESPAGPPPSAVRSTSCGPTLRWSARPRDRRPAGPVRRARRAAGVPAVAGHVRFRASAAFRRRSDAPALT